MVSGREPTPTFVPNRDRAEVPLAKVTLYLLNTAHPDGAPKAAFFTAFGFTQSEPDRFVAALLEHVRNNPATETAAIAFGDMYTVDAPLACPDGRTPLVRSVWIIEPLKDCPRLVTAYPVPDSSVARHSP